MASHLIRRARLLGLVSLGPLMVLMACADKQACPLRPSAPEVAAVQTPRSEQTNVNLELSARYMRALFRERLESSSEDPAGSTGARATTVDLTQEGVGASAKNLVRVGLVPWVKSASSPPGGTDSGRVDLPRSFHLLLEIKHHLVTAATQPDAATRRRWLDGAEEGVALTFTFVALRDVTFGRDVVCPSSEPPDPIAEKILHGVFDGLRDQKPTVIPTALVTELAGSLTGGSAKVIGANLASDGDLKLGFTLDAGTPATFAPETLLVHHPADDWGFELDSTLAAGLVTAQAKASVAANDFQAIVDSVKVEFSRQGIAVAVDATHKQSRPCPDIHFKARSLTVLSVLKDPAGKSVLTAKSGTPAVTDDAGLVSKFCYFFGTVIFGKATLVIGPAAPTAPCPGVLGPSLSFGFGTDTFYGTSVDTDETFYISGRSSHLDELLAGSTRPAERPPVPNC
ncbi:hypothetical protein SAMN04488564_10681 [Lentzea waywayandensis]|uniref:Uncharacterized protein n=1 Tax=Lentzea waywayandensis TaxID=84724 RepID=A0A1I6EX13_9PSEU|nr:hypothetical protein [Lentzea waywayandensis]SFR22157.1 hypothetical protein SAMN04488564_10681 [Lentzea waywayandensis]